MRILKAIGVAVMALVGAGGLVSCGGGGGYPMSPEGLQARGLKPGEGYIVATYREKTVRGSGKVEDGILGARSNVFATAPGATGGVALGPYQTLQGGNPYFHGARRSEELAIPVPAGRYSISGWSMVWDTLSVRNRLPMDASFEVKAGEATYVGRMHAIAFMGRNLLGLPLISHGFVMATDEFAQDQARIAKAYPMIKSATIHRSNVPAEYQKEMKRIAGTPEESAWKKLLGQ